MKSRVTLVALLLAAALQAQEHAPQNDSIRKEDLRADLMFYASDAMRGRLVDTVENRIATEFIKSRFERLGLKPAAGDSYFHAFDLVSATLGDPNELQISTGDGVTRRPVAGQDFVTVRFSGSAHTRGPVVFAGFGITAPAQKHDDYPADLVRGKIVLVVAHEPGERDPKSPFSGLVTAEAAIGWRKALAAQQKGAIGILFADDVHNHPEPANLEATARATWPENPSPRAKAWTLAAWLDQLTIPAVQISRTLAADLVRSTGKTLQELSASAETVGGVTPLALPGVEVEMTTTVRRPVTATRNVAALVEGSDPRLKDEVVVVVAHLDHEGVDGQIFNGADDNGSGTVALLEIAEAYALAARAGQRPRRSVLFLSVNAEERGLLGAWAYTERPIVPLDRTAAVLNLDMIGRNEEIPPDGGPRFFGLEVTAAAANTNSLDLFGYSFAPELAAAIERANTTYGLTLKQRLDNSTTNLVRRTDHWPFLHNGVPAIAFHTGLHPDYHTPTDDPGKINYDKMERIARLVHSVSWALANQTARVR